MTPTDIPTKVIREMTIPTETTTRKTRPTPRFFQGDSKMPVTIASGVKPNPLSARQDCFRLPA